MWRETLKDAIKPYVPEQHRRMLARARLQARQPTGAVRILPDVLVVGAMRCGTSSLYRTLGAHPSVVPSLRKEIGYFSVDHARGENWYRAHFPTVATRAAYALLGRSLLTFECTPDYLLSQHAPRRAKALLPDAKIIVLLRDPVERAFSHYKHIVAHKTETLSFKDALAAEDERIRRELDDETRSPDAPMGKHLLRFSLRRRGHYKEQLARWLEHYDGSRVLVADADGFFSNPAALFDRVLSFVGLPSWMPSEFKNYSYTDQGEAAKRKQSKIEPALVEELRAHFARENEGLDALVKKTSPLSDYVAR